MKISDQPTNHILVRASCQSEWDVCDFAIIFFDYDVQKQISNRLAVIDIIKDAEDLGTLQFYDFSAGFYVSDDDEIELLLPEDRVWAFVEIDPAEEEGFRERESRTECRMLNIYIDGTGQYTAYGKHSGEEYYTYSLPFAEILEQFKLCEMP